MQELLTVDFGGPLHCFVIAGQCDEVELQMLERYHWDRENRKAQVFFCYFSVFYCQSVVMARSFHTASFLVSERVELSLLR